MPVREVSCKISCLACQVSGHSSVMVTNPLLGLTTACGAEVSPVREQRPSQLEVAVSEISVPFVRIRDPKLTNMGRHTCVLQRTTLKENGTAPVDPGRASRS